TASLPEEDRHSYSRDYLEGQLAYLFGGRAAEELVFGPEKVTTGAGNDIERATSLARRMVTVFGMSDVIGPMAVGDAEHEVFLGREIVQRRELSEKMAELVDSEIKRLLTEAYERAMRTLQENRDLLERLANALLERETPADRSARAWDEAAPGEPGLARAARERVARGGDARPRGDRAAGPGRAAPAAPAAGGQGVRRLGSARPSREGRIRIRRGRLGP